MHVKSEKRSNGVGFPFVFPHMHVPIKFSVQTGSDAPAERQAATQISRDPLAPSQEERPDGVRPTTAVR